jgi:hypothetical protein
MIYLLIALGIFILAVGFALISEIRKDKKVH